MICTWPGCTGVHDNNRYAELCPRSREAKRLKDSQYEGQSKVKTHRYLLDLTARIERYAERVAAISGSLPTIQPGRGSEDAWREHCEEYANRPKRERPKVPTICAGRGQVISVARVVTATRRPDVRWRVA